ncbi:MAG: energy transducer TonB [Moraxellaceae bacterium]|nr:energy transducer TonB [Moraxellaceae bacterium]
MNNKLIYITITLFVVSFHMVVLLLFFKSNSQNWYKQVTNKSDPIYIEFISAKKTNSSTTKIQAINKQQVKDKKHVNKKIASKKENEVKLEKKSANVTTNTKNNQIKEEVITIDESVEDSNIDTNQEIKTDKQSLTTETEKKLEVKKNNTANNYLNNQTKPQVIKYNSANKNNNYKKYFANYPPINVDEENENEGENEDNVELAGFENLYRSQYNERTIDYNKNNKANDFIEPVVFDDIIFVVNAQAEKHLIERLPAQLPMNVVHNNAQKRWQVIVTFYVDKHGNVLTQPIPFIKPLHSSGNRLVDENALQYVRLLRFQPFIKNNKAVVAEVEFLVSYD